MAVCDNPDEVPVDPGVEAAVGRGSRGGWSLAASVHRIWYSYWLGYPGLVHNVSASVQSRLAAVPAGVQLRWNSDGIRLPLSYGGNGTLESLVPRMECR